MSELFTLFATGTDVANTLISSRSEAAAIKAQSSFTASQLRTQARLSDIHAKSAEIRGEEEAREKRKETKVLIGEQRARLAAQGIEIDSGSALDIQLEASEVGAVDALTIKNNAFREAAGYRIEAIDLRGQASFTELAGESKARATILTGGLTAATKTARGISKVAPSFKTLVAAGAGGA